MSLAVEVVAPAEVAAQEVVHRRENPQPEDAARAAAVARMRKEKKRGVASLGVAAETRHRMKMLKCAERGVVEVAVPLEEEPVGRRKLPVGVADLEAAAWMSKTIKRTPTADAVVARVVVKPKSKNHRRTVAAAVKAVVEPVRKPM